MGGREWWGGGGGHMKSVVVGGLVQYDSEANKYNKYTHFFHAGRKRAVAGPLPKELFTKVF